MTKLNRISDPRYKVIFEETGEVDLPYIKNALVDNIYTSLDKDIKDIKLADSELILTFLDDHVMVISDLQECLEERYFTTDDKLEDYIGSKFLGIVIKEVGLKNEDASDDGLIVHEISFMEIKTSKGPITIAAHNEHNGWYGGINISVHVKPPLDASPTSLQ